MMPILLESGFNCITNMVHATWYTHLITVCSYTSGELYNWHITAHSAPTKPLSEYPINYCSPTCSGYGTCKLTLVGVQS